MIEPKTIAITLQDRLYPSDEDVAFLDTYLADFQKLKRILFSKLYGQLRPKNLNEFKRVFLKEYDVTSTYYSLREK